MKFCVRLAPEATIGDVIRALNRPVSVDPEHSTFTYWIKCECDLATVLATEGVHDAVIAKGYKERQ